MPDELGTLLNDNSPGLEPPPENGISEFQQQQNQQRQNQQQHMSQTQLQKQPFEQMQQQILLQQRLQQQMQQQQQMHQQQLLQQQAEQQQVQQQMQQRIPVSASQQQQGLVNQQQLPHLLSSSGAPVVMSTGLTGGPRFTNVALVSSGCVRTLQMQPSSGQVTVAGIGVPLNAASLMMAPRTLISDSTLALVNHTPLPSQTSGIFQGGGIVNSTRQVLHSVVTTVVANPAVWQQQAPPLNVSNISMTSGNRMVMMNVNLNQQQMAMPATAALGMQHIASTHLNLNANNAGVNPARGTTGNFPIPNGNAQMAGFAPSTSHPVQMIRPGQQIPVQAMNNVTVSYGIGCHI